MPSLVEQFERQQCIITGARCRVGADGTLREWTLYCTPNDDAMVNGRTPSTMRLMMAVYSVKTDMVYVLAKRALFHPQLVEFIVEDAGDDAGADTEKSSNKVSSRSNFSVSPAVAVDLDLSLRVRLSLLAPFVLHWLVVDHWLRLLSILCSACPRLASLTLALSFVPPALRPCWLPSSSRADCSMRSLADAVAYVAELMERKVLTVHMDAGRLQWLWLKLRVVGLCETEFVKLACLRRTHSLFVPSQWSSPSTATAEEWNCQTHVIFDQIGREHWMSIEIVDPGGGVNGVSNSSGSRIEGSQQQEDNGEEKWGEGRRGVDHHQMGGGGEEWADEEQEEEDDWWDERTTTMDDGQQQEDDYDRSDDDEDESGCCFSNDYVYL